MRKEDRCCRFPDLTSNMPCLVQRLIYSGRGEWKRDGEKEEWKRGSACEKERERESERLGGRWRRDEEMRSRSGWETQNVRYWQLSADGWTYVLWGLFICCPIPETEVEVMVVIEFDSVCYYVRYWDCIVLFPMINSLYVSLSFKSFWSTSL